jgi:hypothetical protein
MEPIFDDSKNARSLNVFLFHDLYVLYYSDIFFTALRCAHMVQQRKGNELEELLKVLELLRHYVNHSYALNLNNTSGSPGQ